MRSHHNLTKFFPPFQNINQPQLVEEDPAKLSRLFYLQLYSSVLNSPENQQKEKTGPNRKFTLPKVLSDFTNTLLKKKEAIKRTFSEDYERNSSQTLHETIVNEKRPVLPTLSNLIWLNLKLPKIAIMKGLQFLKSLSRARYGNFSKLEKCGKLQIV